MEDKTTEQKQLWSLWRQDDHGNRFLIKEFSDREEAEKSMKHYESKGHKQIYWIEPIKD